MDAKSKEVGGRRKEELFVGSSLPPSAFRLPPCAPAASPPFLSPQRPAAAAKTPSPPGRPDDARGRHGRPVRAKTPRSARRGPPTRCSPLAEWRPLRCEWVSRGRG